MSFEIPGFIRKTEEVVYEFMVIFILYPVALYKSIVSFKKMILCVNKRKDFSNYYFPPASFFLFTCFMTVLLSPYQAHEVISELSDDSVALLKQSNNTLIFLVFRILVFLPFPFAISVIFDCITPGKINRNSFREPFEVACIISSPMVLFSSICLSQISLQNYFLEFFIVLFIATQLWYLISTYYIYKLKLKKLHSVLAVIITYLISWSACLTIVSFLIK